jgi:hypothetical protein
MLAGSLSHPVLYGDVLSDEVVWDVWARGPAHPTLHHRCLFPTTNNALPELVRTGLLLNSTVDTLGNQAGATPAAAGAAATLAPVLLSLLAGSAAGTRVPLWASKVRALGRLSGVLRAPRRSYTGGFCGCSFSAAVVFCLCLCLKQWDGRGRVAVHMSGGGWGGGGRLALRMCPAGGVRSAGPVRAVLGRVGVPFRLLGATRPACHRASSV